MHVHGLQTSLVINTQQLPNNDHKNKYYSCSVRISNQVISDIYIYTIHGKN